MTWEPRRPRQPAPTWLGAGPCGVFYRTVAPDTMLVPCGRPGGHSGPHWAEATQADVADLAGIRRVPPRAS